MTEKLIIRQFFYLSKYRKKAVETVGKGKYHLFNCC